MIQHNLNKLHFLKRKQLVAAKSKSLPGICPFPYPACRWSLLFCLLVYPRPCCPDCSLLVPRSSLPARSSFCSLFSYLAHQAPSAWAWDIIYTRCFFAESLCRLDHLFKSCISGTTVQPKEVECCTGHRLGLEDPDSVDCNTGSKVAWRTGLLSTEAVTLTTPLCYGRNENPECSHLLLSTRLVVLRICYFSNPPPQCQECDTW